MLGPAHKLELGARMQTRVSFLFSLDSDYKLSIISGGDGKTEEEVGRKAIPLGCVPG